MLQRSNPQSCNYTLLFTKLKTADIKQNEIMHTELSEYNRGSLSRHNDWLTLIRSDAW